MQSVQSNVGVRSPLPGVVYPRQQDLQHYVNAGALTHETLIGALVESFQRNADRIALRGGEGETCFAELDRLTTHTAAGLIALGLSPLDRVLFQMANSRELLVAVIASWKAGLIPVCTLVSHREAELGYLADHSEAKAIFVDGDNSKFDQVAFAKELQKKHQSLRFVVSCRGPSQGVPTLTALATLADGATAKQKVAERIASLDPFQVAVFQLSGGTTGIPKIIPRFHNEYLYNMRAVHQWTGRESEETVFCAGPLVHNAGMVCHWGPALLHGGCVITERDLSVEGLRRTFVAYKPTWMFLMRPILVRLKEALEDHDQDLSHVTGVISSSHAQFVRQELSMPGFHFFGMAEGLIMSTRTTDSIRAIEQSIGLPISPLDEVRLYKPGTEQEVQPGEVGELVCKGPYTFCGYYDAEERNSEAFTSDGFYRSGDLVSSKEFDGNRYYIFEGRIKDVINRGGEKISCDEVERALRDYPGLVDVAIVAMPDDVYIEKGCAFACMETGSPAPSVLDFGRHLEQKGLAKYKWPERVEVVGSLPMTLAGKVSKAALREEIRNTLAQEAQTAPVKDAPQALELSGVHHTARPTWKLKETVEFYRDTLGLPLVHAISAKGWGREGHPDFLHFFFDSGRASTIAFFYYIGTDRPDYLSPRPEEFFYRSTHTAWQVETRDELLAWKRRLESKGVDVSPVTRHEVIESIYFVDPNGYPVEITFQVRPFVPRDAKDARLTVDAAIQTELHALADGGRLADIDTVWRQKALLVESHATES